MAEWLRRCLMPAAKGKRSRGAVLAMTAALALIILLSLIHI